MSLKIFKYLRLGKVDFFHLSDAVSVKINELFSALIERQKNCPSKSKIEDKIGAKTSVRFN